MSSGVLKGIIIAVMIIWIVSPVDACPGFADDLIVLLAGLISTKAIGNKTIEDC